MCPKQTFSNTHHIFWVDDISYDTDNYEQLMEMLITMTSMMMTMNGGNANDDNSDNNDGDVDDDNEDDENDYDDANDLTVLWIHELTSFKAIFCIHITKNFHVPQFTHTHKFFCNRVDNNCSPVREHMDYLFHFPTPLHISWSLTSLS